MLPIHDMLLKLSQGQAVRAEKVWRPHRGFNGKTLFETWDETPLAGAANRYTERRRRGFTSAAAQRLLAHHRGQVHVPVARAMKQSEVGQPRPIMLKTTEQRSTYVKHVAEAMWHGEYEFLSPGEKSPTEIVIPEHIVVSGFPPKPRIAIRGDLTKEPVKQLMESRHWQTGSTSFDMSTANGDLLMGTDQPRAYKQYEVTKQTAWRQLICIDFEIMKEALATLGRNIPRNVRTQRCRGRLCVIVRARVMQFGDPLSAEMFVKHNRLMLAELRQLGVRIVDQMDDDVIQNRLGPTSTIADFMVKLDTFDYYGTVCHTNTKIADWPVTHLVFDGAVVAPVINRRFVPPEKDARHRTDMLHLLSDLKDGRRVSLRRLTSVIMQQASTIRQCYYVRFLLIRPRAYLSRETRRCNQEAGNNRDPYAMSVQRPNSKTVKDMQWLAMPKVIGQYMRPPSKIIADIWMDTSSWATGVKLTKFDTRSGQVQYTHRMSFFLTAQERRENHTVQENLGVTIALSAVMTHYDLRSEGPDLQVIRYGSDNTASVAAANRSSINERMSLPMAKVMLEARNRGLVVQSVYIPKTQMDRTHCDYDGRRRSHNQQWKLDPQILAEAMHIIGEHRPPRWWIDMAACRATRQCQRYWARTAEPEAAAVDVLLQNWANYRSRVLYCYPPEKLLPQILQKAREQKTTILLIAPLIAATRTYWVELLEMLTQYVIIPHHEKSHSPPEGWTVEGEALTDLDSPPPWNLILGRISLPGWTEEESTTQRQPPISCYQPTRMGTVRKAFEHLGPISQTGMRAEEDAETRIGSQNCAPI